jgi:predicted DNA-binding transcriptional regulator AlpA
VVAPPSDCEHQRDELSDNIKRRVQRTLERFNSLPDDALVEIRVVSALIDRSPASIYRDVAKERLPPPVRVGAHSSRWHVGAIRAVMKEGAK